MTKQVFIDFTFVKEHADFDKVLTHYRVKVARRSGAQLRIHCPFHDDEKPSGGVDTAKKRFNCFAGTCGAKGNILEFVARMEGTDDLRQAAEILASICGIGLAPPKAPTRSREPAEEKRWPLPAQPTGKTPKGALRAPEPEEEASPEAEEVNPPLTFTLKLDPEHPYIATRGISAATAESFGLGYANRGIMKGRLCIPIRNEVGELVAYAGRFADGDDQIPEGEERYKLPPNFRKNRVLFNLDRVRDAKRLVIVEGYFGVIRLAEIDIDAVALMGSSLAEEQLALLRALPALEAITLFLDGDAAGRKARSVILPRLSPFWLVHAPELPEGTEPDTLPERELLELLAWPA